MTTFPSDQARELERRLLGCSGLRADDLRRFATAGIPLRPLWDPDQLARADVVFAERLPCFEFASESNDDPETIEAYVFLARDAFGEPIDLVAWQPRSGQIASWQGAACILGGESLYRPRLDADAALVVHRSPLEWLRGNRYGLVIVDEGGAADLLCSLGSLEVSDERYAQHLRRALARPAPRVLVRAPAVSARAAA